MRFSVFEKYNNVQYGISNRTHGPLKNFPRDDEHENVRAARKKFLDTRNVRPAHEIFVRPVHGNKVIAVHEPQRLTKNGDALITDRKNILLGITVADCYPIYAFDPEKNVVAIAHVGWRGVVDGIIDNLIDSFLLDYASEPSNIVVGVGPGIQDCHFEIGKDVLPRFEQFADFIRERNKHLYVDLSGIISQQALLRGIHPKNFEMSDSCTYCDDEKFFSRRRDKDPDEVMLAYIAMA